MVELCVLLLVVCVCFSVSSPNVSCATLSGSINVPPARIECKKCGALNIIAFYDCDNKPDCRECGCKI